MSETVTPTNDAQRRSERISVRVTSDQKRLIQQAAAFEGRTLADFILGPATETARLVVQARERASTGGFEVLCRIDAFADYVAEVEAEDAEEAAQLARDNHEDYRWEHRFTQEFDARLYVTLDADGAEIEATQVGDF